MDKYKEAQSKIARTLVRIIGYPTFASQVEKDFDVLDELVEKATPKKVLKRETNGQEIKVGNGTFKLATMWYCPSCKNWISPSTSVNNCGHCGQAIDWSEEDE